MKKKCELCDSMAKMYCESDRASLCWDCDIKVHGANFLVAKHSRTLLCRVCQSLTPWHASGPKLGPTVSVCANCVSGSNKESRNEEQEDDNDDDTREEEEEEHSTGEEEDDDHDDDADENDDDDDDDEENQVVPWSPPPASTNSLSDEECCSTTERLNFSKSRASYSSTTKRRRFDESEKQPVKIRSLVPEGDNGNFY